MNPKKHKKKKSEKNSRNSMDFDWWLIPFIARQITLAKQYQKLSRDK